MAKPMTREKAQKKIEESDLKKHAGKGGIAIKAPNINNLIVKVVGLSPFLAHQFSPRLQAEILKGQMEGGNKRKGGKAAREPKNVEREYTESRYVNERGQDCIPARFFKKSLINAAVFTDTSSGIIKGSVFVIGELLPLKYKNRVMRQDMARTPDISRKPLISVRAEYHGWECDVPVTYDEDMLPLNSLLALFRRAGYSIGVGDWRPQKSGEHGRFNVATVATVLTTVKR